MRWRKRDGSVGWGGICCSHRAGGEDFFGDIPGSLITGFIAASYRISRPPQNLWERACSRKWFDSRHRKSTQKNLSRQHSEPSVPCAASTAQEQPSHPTPQPAANRSVSVG